MLALFLTHKTQPITLTDLFATEKAPVGPIPFVRDLSLGNQITVLTHLAFLAGVLTSGSLIPLGLKCLLSTAITTRCFAAIKVSDNFPEIKHCQDIAQKLLSLACIANLGWTVYTAPNALVIAITGLVVVHLFALHTLEPLHNRELEKLTDFYKHLKVYSNLISDSELFIVDGLTAENHVLGLKGSLNMKDAHKFEEMKALLQDFKKAEKKVKVPQLEITERTFVTKTLKKIGLKGLLQTNKYFMVRTIHWLILFLLLPASPLPLVNAILSTDVLIALVTATWHGLQQALCKSKKESVDHQAADPMKNLERLAGLATALYSSFAVSNEKVSQKGSL